MKNNIPREVTLEDFPCPMGCSSGDSLLFTAHDILHNLPGEYNVVKCNCCDLVRTNPRPTPDTIGYYYPTNYGPYLGTRVSQEKEGRIKSVLRRIARFFYNSNSQKTPAIPPGRMLELGCASGSYLHKMAQAGWQVQGIEYSATAAESAAKLGYQVYVGPLEAAPNPEGKFDLIVGWMVFEHLHDPVKCLTRLKDWVEPDGWLVLSMPNAASDLYLFKDKGYALQLPCHLYHYTPDTLNKILAKTGWKIERIFHHRSLSNLVGSLGYILEGKGFGRFAKKMIEYPERGGVWPYLLYPLAWLLSLIGLTGRMTIWARKI